ncbi:hypothetical protein Rruber_00236 [Rhodococcus ruber]
MTSKARRHKRKLVPGDRIKVPFGNRMVLGVVTGVRGGRVHVSLKIEGAEDPVGTLYREDELTPV